MSDQIGKEGSETQVERLAYNTREACMALGVSVTTLWRLEKRGAIKALGSGLTKKLYSVRELRRFVDSCGKAS